MTYREALLSLYDRDGFLTPEQVVREATDYAHPLHGYFEWDESVAARRYRLSQAGELIRRCKVTVQFAPDEIRKVRAFTHVAAGDHVTYMPTEEALRPENRDVVLAQAMRELAQIHAKYKTLIDFSEVVARWLEEQGRAAA